MAKTLILETRKTEIHVFLVANHFANLSPMTIWMTYQVTPEFIILGEEVGKKDVGNVPSLLLAAFRKDYKKEISSK